MVGSSLRALAVLAASLLLASFMAYVIVAPGALAHSNEISADPPADSVLDAMPAQVSLSFDEPLLDAGAALVVTSASGDVISKEPASIEGATIRVALSSGGPGTYQVAYRVVSGDGHPVTGSYAFEVAGEPGSVASPSAVPDPAPEADVATEADQESADRLPVLPWAGAAILVIAAIGGVIVLRRRRP